MVCVEVCLYVQVTFVMHCGNGRNCGKRSGVSARVKNRVSQIEGDKSLCECLFKVTQRDRKGKSRWPGSQLVGKQGRHFEGKKDDRDTQI